MTQEEILKQGAPIEPNCFETDREERWYRVGLHEGAKANPWYSVANGDIPRANKNCIFHYLGCMSKGFMRGDKSIFLDNDLTLSPNIREIDYWMEIPELPTE